MEFNVNRGFERSVLDRPDVRPSYNQFRTPPPPPPPPLKAEWGGGPESNLGRRFKRSSLSRPDEHIRYFDSGPPPVKRRTLGGVRNTLWAVDPSAMIWTIGR
jgi:hypothetical protein